MIKLTNFVLQSNHNFLYIHILYHNIYIHLYKVLTCINLFASVWLIIKRMKYISQKSIFYLVALKDAIFVIPAPIQNFMLVDKQVYIVLFIFCLRYYYYYLLYLTAGNQRAN